MKHKAYVVRAFSCTRVVTMHLMSAVCSKLLCQNDKVKTKMYRPFPRREGIDVD